MNHDRYSDDYLRGIFARVKTIAMVGASPRTDRPSNRVMAFLQRKGFRVIPVNPQAAGQTIHGETVVASLAAIAEPIDMVDIFRRSDQVAPVVDDAIAKHAKIVWMQLDVRDDQAAANAEAAGLDVVMNRCPAIEMPRLGL
jgi:predicted CoA-binding protein